MVDAADFFTYDAIVGYVVFLFVVRVLFPLTHHFVPQQHMFFVDQSIVCSNDFIVDEGARVVCNAHTIKRS